MTAKAGDPLEVKLVFELKGCRACKFFWPASGPQPYGPYPTYDFLEDYPKQNEPSHPGEPSFAWIKGVTAAPGFPDPEVADGCRKAPIMTIGINPNLTAFLPGQTGASWAYPNFADTKTASAHAKYAWYYRYRSVYQEHFGFDFIKTKLLPAGRVKAQQDGEVAQANVPDTKPQIGLAVKYRGTDKPVSIPLKWKAGEPRYVLLFNTDGHDSEFKKGDVVAARLDVPAGQRLSVDRGLIGYYEQFAPVLREFNRFLQARGHKNANTQIGEDVCQLDMVACASPHWEPPFLGGSAQSVKTIVGNCVGENAWAVKQLLQTNPAVLYLVGEASYDMFIGSFARWVKSKKPLPNQPADGAFTLLRCTIDPANPVFIEFDYHAGGHRYTLKTRLVVTPHFSYDTNFLPQFRLSPKDLATFRGTYTPCYNALVNDRRISYVRPESSGGYTAFQIIREAKEIFQELQTRYGKALAFLDTRYYSVHALLAGVLRSLFRSGVLSWTKGPKGGHLTRTSGSCHFCVNDHWQFPLGCPYDKNIVPSPPPGFLEAAAEAFVRGGKSEPSRLMTTRTTSTRNESAQIIPLRHQLGGAPKTLSAASRNTLPPLPVVAWQRAGAKAPKLIAVRQYRNGDPLPRADIVILTWTSAEWAALDHVFCDSGLEMPYDSGEGQSDWQKKWLPYSHNLSNLLKPAVKWKNFTRGSPAVDSNAWGSFCMVGLANGRKAIVFKSELHISTDGRNLPLIAMMKQILADAKPTMVFTIGTAGGARPQDALGSVNLTGSAHFMLDGQFRNEPFNNKTFGNAWRPNLTLLNKVRKMLIEPPVTMTHLEELARKIRGGYSLKQLINKDIEPNSLEPLANVLTAPVLTTNGYFVATIDGNYKEYAAMEMDDAVIAMVCDKSKTPFGVVRNISDPVMNAGLPPTVQSGWAGAIYQAYGLYTSYNGALCAWAVASA